MEDESDEYEESIVLVDLNGVPNPSLIKQLSTAKCYVLGINSDAPLIQVGNYVFKGKYKDIPGTGMLFEKESDTSYKYIGKSSTRIMGNRTLLKRNNQPSHAENIGRQSGNGGDGNGVSVPAVCSGSSGEESEMDVEESTTRDTEMDSDSVS